MPFSHIRKMPFEKQLSGINSESSLFCFEKWSIPDLLRYLTLSRYTIIGSSSGTYGVTPVLIDGWNHSFWYGSNKWHACLFIVISWCESISQVRWLVLIVILEKGQVYFIIILSACWIRFYSTMLFFLRV